MTPLWLASRIATDYSKVDGVTAMRVDGQFRGLGELGAQFDDTARHLFPDDLHDASAPCCGASVSHISRYA